MGDSTHSLNVPEPVDWRYGARAAKDIAGTAWQVLAAAAGALLDLAALPCTVPGTRSAVVSRSQSARTPGHRLVDLVPPVDDPRRARGSRSRRAGRRRC